VSAQRWTVGGLIAAAGLAAFSGWVLTTNRVPRPLRRAAAPLAAQTVTDKTVGSGSTIGVKKPYGEQSTLMDFKKRFADAHDYWAFAHDLLPAAKAGNSDAQYYLSKVMEYCGGVNRSYFNRRGERVDLDQALQNAGRMHQSLDLVQLAYDRCNEFFRQDASELGTAADWLASATRAGQPLAQSATASKLVMQGLLDNYAKTGAVPTSIPEPAKVKGDPRELLYEAVQSKDPDVLYNIGELYPALNPDDPDRDVVRFAWILVACERGLDCSANAEWVKYDCFGSDACSSATSSSDFVRFLAGDHWSQVQQRAGEIGAALDNGSWDKLGLGS
jgi:hypothetical protein